MQLTRSLLWLCITPVRFTQASSPPRKRHANNPLTLWSQSLLSGWPKQCCLPRVCVGLEGCTSAFNAMNTIRTCMFYRVSVPPVFLSILRAEEIEHVHSRQSAEGSGEGFWVNPSLVLNRVAQFGEMSFFSARSAEQAPLVALENFNQRSQSIFAFRFSRGARLIVGHENRGVSSEYLQRGEGDKSSASDGRYAEHVVYVPQYGTISSLNVVTSVGIALFYASLDQNFPGARTIVTKAATPPCWPAAVDELEALLRYQRCFREQVPMVRKGGVVTRVDLRPIHPLYFRKDVGSIVEHHRYLRKLLLQVCSQQHGPNSRTPCFGLSVLCENETDLRSVGGIIRSANAFLVDNVFYFGRRKVNVVGTVGSQHYTPPVYLGRSPRGNGNTVDEVKARLQLIENRLEEAGAPRRWWFLDCGHEFLYTQSRQSMMETAEPRECLHKEAVEWYATHRCDTSFTVSLCDPEDSLGRAVQHEVLLVVPQEGVLPPLHILQRCERILSVFPHHYDGGSSPGLPVAVAVGIALQRLGAVMHPCTTLL